MLGLSGAEDGTREPCGVTQSARAKKECSRVQMGTHTNEDAEFKRMDMTHTCGKEEIA